MGRESHLRSPRILIAGAGMALLLLAAPSSAGAATCQVDSNSAYANAVRSTAGLVSYWRLGEASASSAACDSYGSNAGSYGGGVAVGQVGALNGDPDTSTRLDGSSGRVSVPHTASLDVGDSFTVEAWVRRGSVSTPNYQAIVSQGANAWMLAWYSSNRLVLRQASVGDVVHSNRTITDTSWHHVAATKSGSSVKLYIDGADVTGTVSNKTMQNNAIALSIGQSNGGSYLNGTIDDVALYRGALPAATIQSHRDKGAVAPAPVPDPTPTGDPVIAAAGDIACDPADPGYNGGLGTATLCQQKATSDLLLNSGLSGFLTLGDEQEEDGTLAKYQAVFHPTWGRAKKLASSVGNHEYLTPGAKGYFDYHNGIGNYTGPAGDRDKGYYSFNLGSWHIIALNANCAQVSCAAGSPQDVWLREDLARNPTKCTMAIMHQPRWSSGPAGNTGTLHPLVTALYNAKAEVMLGGHNHNYERFARQRPNGSSDSTRGIRQFVVGTGGQSLVGWGTIKSNSQVRNSTTYGVLRMTLKASSYDWKFQPIAGKSFTDSGSTSCH
jgi:acid phosphatase type 7